MSIGVPLTTDVEVLEAIKRKPTGLCPKLPLKPFWPNVMLNVDNSYQFLYRLTPKVGNARSATNIGKLDIVWRTAFGDKGRLQTSQLQRQVYSDCFTSLMIKSENITVVYRVRIEQ